jgi:predicted nucleic acid-binding protein
MTALVIDTSVIIKWYALPREPAFEQAKRVLLAHSQGSCQLHVPLLAVYEVGNVLLQFRGRLSLQDALGRLADLFALELSLHSLTLTSTLTAFELAHTFAITFYDACFVALAQELGASFITADERLARQLASLPFVSPLASYQAV